MDALTRCGLDRARLETLVEAGPTPLFATVSGAHLYGFESPDSDVDLRGAFVAPLDEVLGLSEATETVTLMEDRDGLELDWVAHDVRKFARLMTHRNGYVLEQLYSPLVVHGGPWLDELRDIGIGCITRHLVHHYKGFARGQRELAAGKEPTVKRLLYAYRVYATGIHVLRTGEVVADLRELDPDVTVTGLLERKRAGAEKGLLEPGELEGHGARLDALDDELQQAFLDSALPEEVTSWAALSDFVVRARRGLGDG